MRASGGLPASRGDLANQCRAAGAPVADGPLAGMPDGGAPLLSRRRISTTPKRPSTAPMRSPRRSTLSLTQPMSLRIHPNSATITPSSAAPLPSVAMTFSGHEDFQAYPLDASITLSISPTAARAFSVVM